MRNLRPDEIECRVNIINQKGLSLLLYKTARTDMTILDEVYGAAWSCEYREIKGNLFCGISVKINNEWVTRWDCGVESREDGNGNEKKGEASDSFKRAGTKWGIGRELYTAPKLIWISASDYEGKEVKGKLTTYDTFSVTEIGTENGTITSLKIINDKTKKIVYVLGSGVKSVQKAPAQIQTPKPAGHPEYVEFENLQKALIDYLNDGDVQYFEHPENVRAVIRERNLNGMRNALKVAKDVESKINKQTAPAPQPEQLPIF